MSTACTGGQSLYPTSRDYWFEKQTWSFLVVATLVTIVRTSWTESRLSCKKPYKIKTLNMLFVMHLFISSCNRCTLNCRKYGIQCSITEDGVRSDSKKLLFMKSIMKLPKARSKEVENFQRWRRVESQTYVTVFFTAGFGIHSTT